MRILYLSYTGLLEPLGQSQVLAYLRLLTEKHEIRLITFEKAHDLVDSAAVAEIRALCEAVGIDWRPKRYHHRPRLLAPAEGRKPLAHGHRRRQIHRRRRGPRERRSTRRLIGPITQLQS